MPKDALTHRPTQFSSSCGFNMHELRIAMKYTECEFSRFRVVWASAKAMKIKPFYRHDQVNPDVWDGLIHKCVEKQPKLNSFMVHWPIVTYFDHWNMSRRLGGRGRPRKKPISGHEIPPIGTRITWLFPVKPQSPKFKPSVLLSNGPYGNADPQPCPICRRLGDNHSALTQIRQGRLRG
ncbi:hypothetical protein BDP27DRAFT_1369133 [Rhodocollybia butyracea]|uniref:Uncharacterized protein n=1 Tax=Rhodocollybia butyracea TaxID=206335 RepID=A0A9P5PDX7_9AGAR|nr:hypothetical protein BDP27DRAFT_1369133 [Rhodocollybia butyracea]